jgi:hypothetical protein
MPVYDYQCVDCGHVEEQILTVAQMEAADSEDWPFACDKCGYPMVHIISASGQYCANEDSAWVRTVADIIVKDSADPRDRKFLDGGMTRSDLKKWMKERNLRHYEPGEKPGKPKPPDEKRILRKLMDRYVKRHRIEVR